MAIGNREKMLLHVYRQAAGLTDLEYRRVLLACSGVDSSAHREFDPVHYRTAMARLEALVWTRAAEGLVPDPRKIGPGLIRSETYWRDQAARLDPVGRISTAQVEKINELWQQLQEPLGERWTLAYFVGIVARATGRHNVGLTALGSREGSQVIDALQDKLQQCRRSGAAA